MPDLPNTSEKFLSSCQVFAAIYQQANRAKEHDEPSKPVLIKQLPENAKDRNLFCFEKKKKL